MAAVSRSSTGIEISLLTWAGKATPWFTLQEMLSKPRGMESWGKTGGKDGSAGVWKKRGKAWEGGRRAGTKGCRGQGAPLPAATEDGTSPVRTLDEGGGSIPAHKPTEHMVRVRPSTTLPCQSATYSSVWPGHAASIQLSRPA